MTTKKKISLQPAFEIWQNSNKYCAHTTKSEFLSIAIFVHLPHFRWCKRGWWSKKARTHTHGVKQKFLKVVKSSMCILFYMFPDSFFMDQINFAIERTCMCASKATKCSRFGWGDIWLLILNVKCCNNNHKTVFSVFLCQQFCVCGWERVDFSSFSIPFFFQPTTARV